MGSRLGAVQKASYDSPRPLDGQPRNLRGIANSGLPDLDDLFFDNLRQGIFVSLIMCTGEACRRRYARRPAVTNIRNTSSPALEELAEAGQPLSRAVQRFTESAPEPNPETKQKRRGLVRA
jgi:hypothetical protein